MQNVMYSFLAGLAFGVISMLGFNLAGNAGIDSVIDSLRREYAIATDRAGNLTIELGYSIEEAVRLRRNYIDLRDAIVKAGNTSENIKQGIESYGRINEDFARFLCENGATE